MAQQIWTFKDDFGQDHSFGIYHGEDTGHFVAYLDNNVLLIDFNILGNKDYHFFINNIMMKFKIEKQQQGFLYTLNQDTETDTPYNRELAKDEKMNKFVIFMFVIIFLIGLKIIARIVINHYR